MPEGCGVVDENENPGYFTTGSYKIIYNLDGGEETENPTSLPLSGATSDITLKKPTKEGYFFTGWSGTSATGLTGDNNTGKEVQNTAAEFASKGVKKLILDLRGNGGGYVSAAQDLLSLWLDGEKILIQKRYLQIIRVYQKIFQDNVRTSG